MPESKVDPAETDLRMAQDLLFFAYRDFTNAADVVLAELGLGRAHHRALHFIGRNPGITVSDLLGILRITKQSLARVLSELMERGYVAQSPGSTDRRQRLLSLTAAGAALERRLFERQQERLRPGLSRGRRRRGGRLPPRAARHHGRRRARLYRHASPEGRLMAEDAHILVVDDDARLRALLSRYLAGEGFRVTTAETAAMPATSCASCTPT